MYLSSISFLCIWFNAFIYRNGIISKFGTVVLLLVALIKIFDLFVFNRKKALLGLFLLAITVLLHRYAIRDALLMILIFWAFSCSNEVCKGFYIALKIFLGIGFITIILSLLGIGNSPLWGPGRFLGRYRLGFVTSYHLAEFFLVFWIFCLFHFNKKVVSIISIFLLITAFILSGSRVGIISFIAVSFVFLFVKNRNMWKFYFLFGLTANIFLIIWLCQSGFYQNVSSSRNVIAHAIGSLYEQSPDLLTMAFGIINNSQLASLVHDPSWVTSVPIDGIGMKMFATGIFGAVLAVSFLVYLYTQSVIKNESYFILIVIIFLGLGSDMLNTWHIITFFLFYSICKDKNSDLVGYENRSKQVRCV